MLVMCERTDGEESTRAAQTHCVHSLLLGVPRGDGVHTHTRTHTTRAVHAYTQ